MATMNPRYVAYAKAHGRSPANQLATDRKKYPGGCMCGFLVWMNRQRQKFGAEYPECVGFGGKILNQDAWTEFLLNGETE